MPNIKSAKKKVRKDKTRTARNKSYLKTIYNAFKALAVGPKAKSDQVKKAYATIDKAAKRKIIHKNKAARLKAKVSKLTSKKK